MNRFCRQAVLGVSVVIGTIWGGSAWAQSSPDMAAPSTSTASTPSSAPAASSPQTSTAPASQPASSAPASPAVAAAAAQFQAMSPQQIQAIPPDDIRRIPTDVLRAYATPDNLSKLSPAQQAVVQSRLNVPQQLGQQQPQQQQPDQAPCAAGQNCTQTPPCLPGDRCQNASGITGGVRRFGAELFTNPPSTFAQVSDTPVPVNYIMGPGDTIAVQLFGNQNNQFQLVVQRDGSIQFPSLGPIQVTGQTFDAMSQMLLDRISKQMIGTQASITLGALRSIQIFVVGDVNRPGAYTVSSLSKMLNALFVSGGIADTGSFRRVQLKRGGHIVAVLDLYDLLLKGDSSRDAQLRPGDVLFVPPVGKSVTVNGGVLRPAIYELKGSERLSDVLDYAGGATSDAYLSLTKIERIAADDRHVVLDADPAKENGNLAMQDGDVITVKSTLSRLDRMVMVKGYVNREQPFQWRPNLRISDVVASASDLKPLADLNYALLIRGGGKDQHLSVVRFRPKDVFAHPRGDADLVLAAKDELRFFGFDANRAAQVADLVAMLRLDTRAEASSPVITVQGAVQEAGSYPLTEGMTLQDAISAAISTNKDAWLQAALVVRRDIRNSTIKVYEVSLLPDAEDMTYFRLEPSDTLIVFTAAEDRQGLLGDVIARLKQQATPTEPAKIFTVNGQVKFPGEYPLVERSTLQGAIALAGGFTEPAYPYSYEVTRQSLDERGRFTIKTIDLNLADQGKGQSADEQSAVNGFALASRDTLVVRTQPGYQETETIELRGEVRFPGVYRAHRGETLAQVVQRAGGLTRFADPEAAVFTREELRATEQAHLEEIQADMAREMARLAVTKADESGNGGASQQLMLATLSDKVSKLHGVGRLVIDLPNILKGDSDLDVQVKNGDVLVVPGVRQEIIVLGEVNYPTSHRIKAGSTVRDYLNRSGGFTQAADTSRVYVIRANGEVVANAVGWFSSKNVKAGDTVVVPLDLEPIRPLPLLTSIAQIAGQIAITAASLKVIGAF